MKKDDSDEKTLSGFDIPGMDRRRFLKYCAATAAVFGLSEMEFTTRLAQAMESASSKPPVIWLEGQDCAGCTVSFTGILNPPAASIILDKISLRYHETAMAASGDLAESVYREAVKQGGYVLIVEGSIPTVDDRFCMVGGRPFREIVEEAAKNAAAIIAVGACASYGGIPAAGPTKAVGLNKLLPGKTVINLPTCPVHPDHLAGTILYFLATGKAPELDGIGRPLVYFKELIHDNCRRRSYFDAGLFLKDWNDPEQKDYCLHEKGCKGPETFSDCPVRRWNDGINFCIDCGAGCQGCSEPSYYAGVTPLFTTSSELSKKIWAKRESGSLRKKENG